MWQQFDATLRVVIRTDRPMSVEEIRAALEEADEFEIDATVTTDAGQRLTVTAGSAYTETVSPFDD